MIIVHATHNYMYKEEDIIYLKFKDIKEFIDVMSTINAHKKSFYYFIKIVEVKK